MKKKSHLLVLTCAATLLSSPLGALAHDTVSRLDEGGPIVLAQATQKAKPAPSGQCREGQAWRCNAVDGKQKCACVTTGSPRKKYFPKSTRPVIRID